MGLTSCFTIDLDNIILALCNNLPLLVTEDAAGLPPLLSSFCRGQTIQNCSSWKRNLMGHFFQQVS